jgi:class 3 adenylate cyclase/DNA-binding winged helix-turn-helix (wHTH) protein
MRFRILGPLEVLDGVRSVKLGASKPRALLGVLLLHANEVVPIGRLEDELWGERRPATAPKLVQGYVHALRKQLGAGILVTQPPGYRLRVDLEALDLLEFQRATEEARSAPAERAVELRRKALELWRGPPLADVVFEGAARHEVGRLSELHLATQIELLEAELELGFHAQLVGELEPLVAAHPYQERLRELLMLALYRSGRQAEALEAYQAARRVLSEELGLEPGQALRDLEAAILRQDEALTRRSGRKAPVPEAPSAPSRAPQVGELRPVTALFADVVGSRALAERLSPDELRELVGGCMTQMSQAVEEYGGTVQAYQGDSICAYFGVPVTHEDDPERAARSALRIQEVVGDYARDIAEAWAIPDFAVRVGINTGTVSVGRVGAGNPQIAAFGDAINVAAHVTAAAAPGTIAVGEETARRLAQRFTVEPVGAFEVGGRTEPVRASRLVGSLRVSRRPGLRPIVGRESEVERVRTVAAGLDAGRGQTLLLVGEPGIGKSRTLAELRSIVPERVSWLEGHCLSFGGLPSWPFVEALHRWLGIESGDAEVVVRTRARARLTPLFGDDETGALPGLARLLGVETGDEPREVRRAYVAWIEALAGEAPVVLAIEDLHWAHVSTRELAEEILELTDRVPLLLVATLRRDTASEGWRFRTRVLSDFSHRATEIALDPLSPTAATQILATLLPGGVDEKTREGIVSRAEGNPLYLEELLRALLEGGGLERRHRTWTTTLAPSSLLPPALENLLVARIDRLADGPRRLAQVAAVLGREFPVRVLEHVAGEGTGDDLAELLRAEIVRELRRYPELVCAFRHGLLQEAALSSLTPGRRRELYAAVAAAFEELHEGALDDYLEQLAHYHAQSGSISQATAYLERAAARADELGAESRAAELRQRADRPAAGIDGTDG